MSEVKTTQGLKMRGYLDLTNLPKSQVKKVKFMVVFIAKLRHKFLLIFAD